MTKHKADIINLDTERRRISIEKAVEEGRVVIFPSFISDNERCVDDDNNKE